MKKIGLIGGMSWESSALYYRLINEDVRDRLGGLHSARCVMGSVDFADIERMQVAGEWTRAGEVLANEARALERAGAEVIALCTNTMHKVAGSVEDAISVPFVHVVDVTADAVRAAGVKTVALLGTRFTMEEIFYRDRMRARGVETLIPDAPSRAAVDHVIFDELVRGIVRDESREAYRAIIERLVSDGAEGVILGCTEIELLIRPEDVAAPSFASTSLHARAIVDAALA
ncbi:aspartate/glutamate racemase family protein [Microbacterium suaedae]|uniref:aspartate/glutamate racemase family protein n=1 Tax=Microbacterium suaedae TaxID=2067813 RepID=UPI000DA132C9|nr:aspartate/glutamate racemase family protein [Microbacterium suaedae]